MNQDTRSETPAPAVGAQVEREVRRLLAEGKTTAHMTRDERHDFVVREFPGGLNGIQFAALTLVSAGDDEIVDPPSLADWWKRQSLILGLWVREGLIERRCRRDEAGPYYLTAKARAYLKTPNVEFSGGAPLHGAASAGTQG